MRERIEDEENPVLKKNGSKKLVVECPNCGASVAWDSASRFRPFCSERCKLIELGKWADEAYNIPDTSSEANEI